MHGKPVLQFIVSDSKGLPGKICGAAVLAQQQHGGLKWTALTATGNVKEEVELPLTRVLARMERHGVRIDRVELQRLSGLMETEIARLTAEVHVLAGKPFNISSPQQLGLYRELDCHEARPPPDLGPQGRAIRQRQHG